MSMFLKKKHFYKISMIGAGNVASLLAPALESAGHAIKEVYSRKKKNAQSLCDQLYEAEVKHDLDFSHSPASVFIIAVPDDGIRQVAEQLILPPDALLLHTSGSIPLTLLAASHATYTGVFYPLQTFSKHTAVNFQEIPLLIEGSEPETLKTIQQLAKSISKHVEVMTSAQRAVLHISAVFASNFTNHMISLAENLAEAHHINFDLLKPLIAETINKSLSQGAKHAQTGPAVRADHSTLERHQTFLKKFDKDLAVIYEKISHSIMNENRKS